MPFEHLAEAKSIKRAHLQRLVDLLTFFNDYAANDVGRDALRQEFKRLSPEVDAYVAMLERLLQ